MTIRHSSETPLALFSLFATITHFSLETWYHVVWGQPLQALLVDYIGNALMFLATITSLQIRPRSAAGLLAGAWCFYLGFSWRSVFGRLELLENGEAAANGEAGFVLPLITFGLVIVAICMIWSLWLAWKQATQGKISQ
ncbi:MAG: hypothetical protein AAF250_02780 [Pseudomonadota bacterium]